MSIRNFLVKAYMRLTNYKASGDELTLEERQKDNMPAPPADVAQNTDCETVEVDGARAIWLNRQNAKNGALVYLHGGSYIAGPVRDQWLYLADMSRRTQMSALLIDYRLAPQNPFPSGLDDVLMIVETLRATGDLPERWFLLGDSAGAGLAMATVYELHEMDASLQPKKLILMSGWFDVTLENPDIEKNYNQDPMLSRKRLTEAANSYAGSENPKNPLISPLYGNVSLLPPTLIQIGTSDIFLWENRALHRKCLDAGVKLQYEEYPNTFHDFMMVSFLPEAKKARKSQAEFLLG